jgi:hypothetical protein
MKLWWLDRPKDDEGNDMSHWMWSTNGTINAMKTELPSDLGPYKTFGELAYQCFIRQGGPGLLSVLNPALTYIFELQSPWNRVVVPVTEPKLTFLGMRNNETGEEYADGFFDFPRPKLYVFDTFDAMLETTKILPYNDEGYVVVDAQWHRVKVKSLKYLACHRLKGESFTIKRAIELALLGEDSEFLSYFPEYIPLIAQAKKAIQGIREELEANLLKINQMTFATQKDYAMLVKDWEFSSFYFGIRSGKVNAIEDFLSTIDPERIEKRMINI